MATAAPAKSEGRFVVEIPIRWSKTDERIALARLKNVQHISNEILAEYLGRRDAYQRDPDLRRLRAELREAKREGRAPGNPEKKAPKSVPAAVTPRVFEFATKSKRNAAWRELRERHGLIGKYDQTSDFVKEITARQSLLGSSGIDAATITLEIAATQRDRVLEYVGVKPRVGGPTKRPKFAGRRNPVTTVTGSSSHHNTGGLTVDLDSSSFTWKGARAIRTVKSTGKVEPAGPLQFPITARLRPYKNDPWLQKALGLPITQVRVLHRMLRGKRRWFVQLIVIGEPPVRPQLRAAIAARPRDTVGVDVGSRHIAAVGVDSAIIADLAPTMIARESARDKAIVTDRAGDRRKKDRWYRRLSRRISIKRARFNGPDVVKTHPKTLKKTRDGKAVGKVVMVPGGIKKGVRLKVSNRIADLYATLAECARGDAAARKNDHGRLVNVLATMGDAFNLEKLSYVAWAKTFGRQTRRHAPGAFEALLRQRAKLFGATITDIKTKSTKLSQVCHGCGKFKSEPIGRNIADRTKPACECGRPEAQRDLYSSFLARFASEDSVDLHAAQAEWTGAFGLLRGARQNYDRIEDRRIFRLFRVEDAQASPFCVPVPSAQVIGFMPLATVETKQSAPASVRDEIGSEHGRTESSGGGGESRPQNRSKPVRRAPLLLFDVREYAEKVRAGPPLDSRPGNTGGIRAG